MANNNQAVEDVEEKIVAPSPDSPDDEYLPVPGTSPQTETEASISAEDKKPGDQPAAEKPAEVEQPKVEVNPQPAKVPAKEEDTELLSKEIKSLSTDYARKDGESTIEYARRLEIIRLRKNNQKLRGEELLGQQPKKTETPAPSPEEDPVDPSELADFEKKAKAAGFVKQSDVQAQTYQERSKTVFDSWLEAHPEYDEVHDPDHILWDALKREFNSGLYNTRPPDPNSMKTILDKIHVDILGIQSTSELSSVKAKQEKINNASHAGASPGSSSSVPEDKSYSSKKSLLARGLKGFTDEEIEELSKD